MLNNQECTDKNTGLNENIHDVNVLTDDGISETVFLSGEISFNELFTSHDAIPPIDTDIGFAKEKEIGIIGGDIPKYNLMDGSDQFLMAVAEATEHLGLKNNTLIETLKTVIQGRFVISLATEQPVTLNGNARREHTWHSDIPKKSHNSQTESHVTDYSTALTALERSNVHVSAIENVTLASQAGVLALLSSTTEQSSQIKTPVKIEIRTYTRKEDDLSDPKVEAAVEKLLSYQSEIDYQTAKGRAAKPVDEWLQTTFVDSKRMTLEELKCIPVWAYRQFNSRLYQAILDKKRTKAR